MTTDQDSVGQKGRRKMVISTIAMMVRHFKMEAGMKNEESRIAEHHRGGGCRWHHK